MGKWRRFWKRKADNRKTATKISMIFGCRFMNISDIVPNKNPAACAALTA